MIDATKRKELRDAMEQRLIEEKVSELDRLFFLEQFDKMTDDVAMRIATIFWNARI